MSKGGRYAKQKQPMDAKLIIMILIAVILVAVIAVLIIGIIGQSGANEEVMAQTPTVPSTAEIETFASQPTDGPDETEATEPIVTTEATTVPTTLPYKESGMDIINVLVVGQSAREGEEYHLSDSMILVTVNKNTKTITLTSFLRDTYVDMPDYVEESGQKHTCGWNRLNVPYHLGYVWGGTGGSMQMLNETLQRNFGIDVDYNVEIDFDGFVGLVDLLGGVDVELDEDEVAYLEKDTGVLGELVPGENTLHGTFALSYARMRHANAGDSDIKRTSRQREVIFALLNKVKDQGFSKLQELVNTALPLITTNMTDEEIVTCMWEILPLLPELKLVSNQCPAEGTYWSDPKEIGGYLSYVLAFNSTKNKQMMMEITEGIVPEN